ncbi:MAG TPA: FecR domain-containing protein [Burkholderiales bacterium]
MPTACKFLIAAIAALAVDSAWATGRFMFVEGTVNVRDAAGLTRVVRAGDPINEQETVVVGEGRAQVRFDDGGWVSLQPRSVFEVKTYEMREEGTTLMALIKGSARAVTGLLAERRPARFRFDTPVATIGIRGTSFQVTLCVQSCDVPDGLYVTGGDGTTFVKNGFGEIDLSHGRTAFVANANTPPQESNVKPVAQVTQTVTTQTVAAASSTNPGEVLPGNFVYNSGLGGYAGPFQTVSVSSFGLAGALTGTVSGQASGVVNGIFQTASASASGIGASAGATFLTNGETGAVVLDSQMRPFSVTLTGAEGGRISATALKAPEMAQNDGILFWGRWVNTTFNFDLNDPKHPATANGSATVNGYLHYLVGVPAGSVPLSGTATYTFIGGSGSTSQAGIVGGGVTNGTLTANFGSNVVSTSLGISHNGTYSASGAAFLTSGNRAAFSNGGGSASGPGGSFGFSFDGFFAGAGAPTAPARAGIGWKINAPDPFVGTAGFKCSTGC